MPSQKSVCSSSYLLGLKYGFHSLRYPGQGGPYFVGCMVNTVNEFLDGAKRQWRMLSDESRKVDGFVQGTSGRHNPVDQADTQSLGGVYRGARIHQLFGLGSPDEKREPLGAAATREATKFDFRLAKGRLLRGDPDVECHRQLEATSQAVAIHRADRWFWHKIDRVVRRVLDPATLSSTARVHAVGKFFDVSAGREGLLDGAADDDHSDLGVIGTLVDPLGDLGPKVPRKDVERRAR